MLDGNGVYFIVAFLATALILGAYGWSLFSRAADARRDAERRRGDPER